MAEASLAPAWCWLLNLDADRELSRPQDYRTPQRVQQQIDKRATELHALTQEEPTFPRALGVHQVATKVLCWSATPSALARVKEAGLSVPKRSPNLEVLRRVNHRRFQLELDDVLPGAMWLEGQAATTHVLHLASGERRFRLKRAHGFSGSDQRRVGGGIQADKKWLRDSVAQGGLYLEPELAVTARYSMHGMIAEDACFFGHPCLFQCDRHDAYTSALLLDAVAAPSLTHELQLRAKHLAAALKGAGYAGPFGFDALAYSGEQGTRMAWFSDVNARFTMAWSIGMGPLRNQALEAWVAAK